MAIAEAVWGREDQARRHAEDALAVGQQYAATFLACAAGNALGLLDLTVGKLEQAAGRLLVLTDPGQPGFNPVGALRALPDAVETAVRTGRKDEARLRLETFRGWVTIAPTQARHALLARSEALLGTRDPDEAFGQAITGAPALPPLERARTELLYGEWLRRERRRTDARPPAGCAGGVPAPGRGALR